MHKILTFIIKFICIYVHYRVSCSELRRPTWFKMFDNNTMTDDVFTNTTLVFAHPGSREKLKNIYSFCEKEPRASVPRL